MPDALVIGGGLAGSAAAIVLAQGGREVMLFEKTRASHHKVCGEFLSREALHYLHRLGVEVDTLGAVPISGVRLAGAEIFAEAELPFVGRSLTRRCLDNALLLRARQVGVTVRQGAGVEGIERVQNGWQVEVADGSKARAADLFVATGKHDLRAHARPEGRQADLLAFKMYFQLAPRDAKDLQGYVELILFPGGYAGLQMVEGGLANLCLLVRRKTWQDVGHTWEQLLTHLCRSSPHLARRLEGASAQLDRPLAVSPIPYGWVRDRGADGLWWLGDQAAVIPSFSGDGMSIALHSGCMAAKMLLAGHSSSQYQHVLCGQMRRQVSFATVLSRLLVGAPWVLRSMPPSPRVLRGLTAMTRIHAELL